MTTKQRIKVDPQPKGLDYLWPDNDSHLEWWEVTEDPGYYYPGTLNPGDRVTVSQEADELWYWVVTSKPAQARVTARSQWPGE